MSSQINVNLSVDGMKELNNKLMQYEQSLSYKVEEFIHRLMDIGITVTNAKVAEAQGKDGDKAIPMTATVTERSGNTYYGVIYLEGSQALFIEFGSGIYFNNGNAHPLSKKFGYGVGTYPNQKHALDSGGWWYRGDDDNLRHSLGTQATMPLFNAKMEMELEFGRIAQEVFSNVI